MWLKQKTSIVEHKLHIQPHIHPKLMTSGECCSKPKIVWLFFSPFCGIMEVKRGSTLSPTPRNSTYAIRLVSHSARHLSRPGGYKCCWSSITCLCFFFVPEVLHKFSGFIRAPKSMPRVMYESSTFPTLMSVRFFLCSLAFCEIC